jgi:hypothetical protein
MHKLHPNLPGLRIGIEHIQHGLTGDFTEVASEQKPHDLETVLLRIRKAQLVLHILNVDPCHQIVIFPQRKRNKRAPQSCRLHRCAEGNALKFVEGFLVLMRLTDNSGR